MTQLYTVKNSLINFEFEEINDQENMNLRLKNNVSLSFQIIYERFLNNSQVKKLLIYLLRQSICLLLAIAIFTIWFLILEQVIEIFRSWWVTILLGVLTMLPLTLAGVWTCSIIHGETKIISKK